MSILPKPGLSVECPQCHRPIGQPCVGGLMGGRVGTHLARQSKELSELMKAIKESEK